MTRLTKALVEALYWRMAWHDSNPDVGMGPWVETVFADMLKETDIKISKSTEEEILAVVRQRRKRENR